MDNLELEGRLARALAPRDAVLEAYLFGSRAAGRAQAHSDVDIAVFVDESALRRQTLVFYPRNHIIGPRRGGDA